MDNELLDKRIWHYKCFANGGRTQPEKRYVLDTVLEHLPRVTGSEGDMNVYVIQPKGHNSSCSCDELGQRSNKGTGDWSNFETQDNYILVVDGRLRDRLFNETKREFIKWLCRLAKRIVVEDILICICSDDKGSYTLQESHEGFYDMFELPYKENEPPNWCEYLLWNPVRPTYLPLELIYKYYNIPEVDEELERRRDFKIKDEE
jgi:hypothetical protein